MAEKTITDNILDWIKKSGGDGYKVMGTATQRGGEPDITGEWYSERLSQWLHLKLEVKTDTGEPTPRQTFRVDSYNKRGYVAGVVRGVEDVQALIAEFENQTDFIRSTDAGMYEYKTRLVAELEAENSQHRSEIASLRLWIDRIARIGKEVSLRRMDTHEGGMRLYEWYAEVKKTLDWL